MEAEMMWSAINLFFSWWAWQTATGAFENKHDALGWLMIFVSAINFASALVSMGL